MRRYLSINWKGLSPKSCQLSSELSQCCLCFNLDHSALSHGVKSHQEDAGMPPEVALTFSLFLWGFQLGQKEQVSFLEADSLLWVDGGGAVTLWLLLCRSLSCWGCTQHSLTCHTQVWLQHNQFLSFEELHFATRAAENASERKCLKNSNGQLGVSMELQWVWSLGWPQIRFVFSQDLDHFTQSWPLGVNITEQGYTTWLKCIAIKCLLMSSRNYPGYGKLSPWKDINTVQQIVWVFLIIILINNFSKLS